jgi:GT2 family glycosyltransferase
LDEEIESKSRMLRDLIVRAKGSVIYRMFLGRWANQRHVKDPSGLVNSLYKAAFGRLAEPEGLANRIHQLQSGVSLEVLAEEFVGSPEFQTRHGTSRSVDTKYLTALYRDGLGLKPDLKYLAYWLAEGKKGATRAKVLASIAGSAEALETGDPPKLDAIAPYSRWIALNDTISDSDRAAIRAHIAGLPFRPLISVIMPIGKTFEAALRKSFHSVITQLYPHWELCIAIDAITESLWTSILSGRARSDPRISVARLGSIESTAAATNAALDLAKGEFVAFLRIGDLLPEHALYEVAIEIAANPRTNVIYSDNDEISAAGQRVNPWFKPGWDPDLLLAQHYIGALAVYRRTLIEEIGFLRPGFEGAELYDLALRATAATAPDRVRHVPAILYHKSDENEATHSENSFASLRAITSSQRAVRDHLDSRGDKEAVLKSAPQFPNAIRVIWPLPEPPPLVSVIVPTRDRADLLARCVDGVLHRTDYFNLELLIVDNGSIEPATETLFDQLTHEDDRVRILRHPGPFNYSALNNRAAREANGEILLLLNNDIDVIEPGWLRELVSQALRPDVGAVGAKLLYPNEQVQHAGMVLGPEGHVVHLHRFAGKNDPGYFAQLALSRTLLAVTGACVAIRRSVFLEVGGLDEVNLPVTFNDVDLCLRLGDHGYRVVWTPFAELFHLECASRGADSDDPAKRERAEREWRHMCQTWGSLLETADPFHNPNVLFHSDYHEIPSTPRRLRPWHYIVEPVLNLFRYFPLSNEAFIEKTK